LTNRCPTCHSDNPGTLKFCGECGTQLPPPQDHPPVMTETLQTPVHELTTGSTFAGRYQVIEELGRGGMGKVYKVSDTKIKEKVALKLIKPEIASDKETLERFGNELRLARKISQRNVCRMFDMGESEGAHFITMEYVHGEDLKSMIRMSGSLSVGMLLSVGKQISDGLAEAHSLGVVHRDLKPQNIMIDKNGNAKIMDFGIARSVREKGITGPSVMIGTPEYMSPEQAEAKEVDHRSDIYSLGVILYEMATNHVPFEGDTALSIAMRHKGEVPKDPRQLNPNIPNDLSGVILKCLEKDKAKRYQSAGEVHAELEKVEKGIPTTERVVPERKTLTSRKITVEFTLKKLLAPAIGVFAVAIIAFLIIRFLPKKQFAPPPASGKPALAILYFENVSADKSLDPWKTALTELLITKLSQSKFINVLDGNTIYSILKKLNLDEAKKYTREDLLKIANEVKATYTLSGSLMKAGPNLIMTLSLQKPLTGEVVSTPSIECKGEDEIFRRVDDLAKTIKSDLKLSPDQIASDIDKHLGTITTHSPEAFKDFIAARNLQRSGFNRESIRFYERAISLDPEFASAILMLGFAYGNLGYPMKEAGYTRRAFELRDKVSERESLFIQGVLFYESEETYDNARKAFEELIQLYPEDYFGNMLLGNVFKNIEEFDKAIERYDICIQNKYNPTYPYQEQADAYRAQGSYDKAREVLEKYLGDFGDNASIHISLAITYICQGEYRSALSELTNALFVDPADSDNPTTKGDIYCLTGELAEAEKAYQNLLSTEEQSEHLIGIRSLEGLYRLQGKFAKSIKQAKLERELTEELGDESLAANAHQYLAFAQLMSGNSREALDESMRSLEDAVKAKSLTSEIRALHLRGLAFCRMNSLEEAKKTAFELRTKIETWLNKKLLRYYYHLMGIIELTERNYTKAIDDMNKACSLLAFQQANGNAHALFIDSLGLAYFQAGDLKKAQTEYRAITMLTTGRLGYGDIYAKSFYMLGRIAERTGDKVEAREHYQKFLNLWEDADPGLPEVEDARKRLAGLKGT